MLQVRKSEERGHAEHGWLDSFHTFSFADYYDPVFMGFRVLRVINEDRISGGRGFPTHPHRDMEIITYVIDGGLEHKDTLGTSSVILPGEVQHMSAGTGVEHSEFNHVKDKPCHLLQIWILPDARGVAPRYGQTSFAEKLNKENLVLVVSKDGRNGSLPIHQDTDLYAAKWSSAREHSFTFRAPNRYGWLQLAKGELSVSGQALHAGDGLMISAEKNISLSTVRGAEFLLFDMP